MNILHIVLGLDVGGLERLLQKLIDNYPPGCKCMVVCLEKSGTIGRDEINCPVVELNKRNGIQLSLVLRLAKIIKQNSIDIIHTHNPSPHVYGSLAGLLCGIPVVHTKHGRNYPNNSRKVMLNRVATCFTDIVVAVSKDAASVCEKIEKVPLKKIKTVVNGIPVKEYLDYKNGNRLRLDFGIPVSTKLIGIVARLSVEKDHETLFRAFKQLLSSMDARLLVVGDGPLRSCLDALVDELGIREFVIFMGTRHDIPKILSGLDVFVLSSTSEGLSLTLLEAMASGLPIVATDVGGNREVIVDGETGFLVPSRNPEALSDKILHLLTQTKLAHEMGQRGRERVVGEFNIDNMAYKYFEIYKSLTRR